MHPFLCRSALGRYCMLLYKFCIHIILYCIFIYFILCSETLCLQDIHKRTMFCYPMVAVGSGWSLSLAPASVYISCHAPSRVLAQASCTRVANELKFNLHLVALQLGHLQCSCSLLVYLSVRHGCNVYAYKENTQVWS